MKMPEERYGRWITKAALAAGGKAVAMFGDYKKKGQKSCHLDAFLPPYTHPVITLAFVTS
ncbi:hypothetical protein JOE11_003732 [Robbsia andropogonis]